MGKVNLTTFLLLFSSYKFGGLTKLFSGVKKESQEENYRDEDVFGRKEVIRGIELRVLSDAWLYLYIIM